MTKKNFNSSFTNLKNYNLLRTTEIVTNAIYNNLGQFITRKLKLEISSRDRIEICENCGGRGDLRKWWKDTGTVVV